MSASAPYVKHSFSSKAAAETVKPVVKTLEQRVLDVIKRCPDGCTDEEIYFEFIRGAALDYPKESTVRARRVRLVEIGSVVAAKTDDAAPGDIAYIEIPVTRKTRSGRNAQVWVAA